MTYYICQEWASTKGNHAGMVHLFSQIHKLDKINTKIMILPIPRGKIKYGLAWLCMLLTLIVKTKPGDTIFFSECLSMGKIDQVLMAHYIKKIKSNVQLIGMVHLIPSMLESAYPTKKYAKMLAPLNKIITLGSSLTSYLIDTGVDKNKVFTSFHYVDASFYSFERKKVDDTKTLECVVLGNLGRDYSQIADIVRAVPNVKFLICKGRKNIDDYFNTANVELFCYMEERQLVELMKRADISLNVMEDTIGSNVICTSLAMSLAMVCSDVGSIRDYCDEGNAYFCKSTSDFVSALNELAEDRKLVYSMQKHSFELASRLQIENFYKNLQQVMSKQTNL